MNNALAATFIVIGVIFTAWSVSMWVKKYRAEKAHSRWVTFLMCAAGVCLGIGAGYVAGINVITDKIGYVPLFVPVVAILGFLFILECKGWRDHHARTPVLGFATALVLFLAVGNSVVTFSGHEIRNVQVADTVVPAKGKG